MSTWSSSTPERMIKVEGRWLRQSAFDAVEPTKSGMTVHLRGGGTLHIPKPENEKLHEWLDATVERLFMWEDA